MYFVSATLELQFFYYQLNLLILNLDFLIMQLINLFRFFVIEILLSIIFKHQLKNKQPKYFFSSFDYMY